MVEISNLTFGYNKRNTLFNNLNLQLKKGHIYGLLGKNGAGKSTLLKNLAGLVFPNSGICRVNGFKSADRVPSFLQELFFIPEEMYLPQISAEQYARSTMHFYPKFDLALYHQILSEFDVPDRSMLHKISFGQQKKVLIAFGLATNTSLLIMDEPTNGLDIPSKMQFRKIIASALTNERCIIISTHQVRDLDSLIDTLLVLHNRSIVLNKSLEQIAEQVQFTTASKVTGNLMLYQEPSGIGVNTISLNEGGSYSKVDMELLFNAIIGDNKSVIEHLK